MVDSGIGVKGFNRILGTGFPLEVGLGFGVNDFKVKDDFRALAGDNFGFGKAEVGDGEVGG